MYIIKKSVIRPIEPHRTYNSYYKETALHSVSYTGRERHATRFKTKEEALEKIDELGPNKGDRKLKYEVIEL